MGGNRENHFEPDAYAPPGPWRQPLVTVPRSTAVPIFVGGGALLMNIARRVIPLTAVGSARVNAGRQRGTDLAPGLAGERPSWMPIVTICAALSSAAILIDPARSQ